MYRCLALAMVLFTVGCGVETVSSAATAAAVKSEEAKQAENTTAQLKKNIDAAMAVGQQRLQDAENSAY